MDGNKAAKLFVIIIGVGLLAVSLLADFVGIGHDPGFGDQQMIVALAGAAILAVGIVIMLRTK